MRRFINPLVFAFIAVSLLAAFAQPAVGDGTADVRQPIYVTPYYNSKGPIIAVGEHSDALRAESKTGLLTALETIEADLPNLPATTLYVAAVRLYDLGARDEAVLWFYRGQFRARAFGSILDPEAIGGIGDPAFEINAAHEAFAQLAGQHINGYGFCDRAKLLATLAQVVEESRALPVFNQIYPQVSFVAKDRWAELIEEVRIGLIAMGTSIEGNWERIASTRAANGMDKLYCY